MKLKRSIKWKLSAVVLVILTALALLTSCNKETVEVVNPPVPVEVVQEVVKQYAVTIVDQSSNGVLYGGNHATTTIETEGEWRDVIYSENGMPYGNKFVIVLREGQKAVINSEYLFFGAPQHLNIKVQYDGGSYIIDGSHCEGPVIENNTNPEHVGYHHIHHTIYF